MEIGELTQSGGKNIQFLPINSERDVMRCEPKWNIFISFEQKPQFSLCADGNERKHKREREKSRCNIGNTNQLAIE